jgi:hypothetical protein
MYDDLFELMVEGAFANKAEFDDFVSEASQEEIYSLIQEGAFKDFEEFKSLYSAPAPQEAAPEEAAPEVKKKDIMEPSLEDGSLVSPESEPSAQLPEVPVLPEDFDLAEEVKKSQETQAKDTRESGYINPMKTLGMYPEEGAVEKALEQSTEDVLYTQANIEAEAPALEAFLKEEARKEEYLENARKKASILDLLYGDVKNSFELKNPYEIERNLKEKYSRHGYYFKRAYDDKLTIISPDGRKEIQVDLKAPTEEQISLVENFINSHYEDDRLKAIVKGSSNLTSKYADAAKVRASREVGRRNKDGSVSTVLMASGEVDGEYVAFPTLFPKDPENYGAAPEYWQELPFGEALDLAKERGEVYYFDTDEEAKEFAEGSWKDVTDADYEGQAFYGKRGLNYMRDKRIVDTYTKARDIVLLIEDDEVPFRQNELTPEDQEKYAELYINGKRREDLQDVKNKYASTVETLEREYLDDEYQDVREDFDVYMQKRYESEIQKAIQVNEIAKSKLESVAKYSLQHFGVADPRKIQLDGDYFDAWKADYALSEFEGAKMTAEAAADQYEKAKLFFDRKYDKSARKRY